MKTNVRKWGSSAGTVIPNSIIKELNINLGDRCDILIRDGGIFIKRIESSESLADLIAQSPLDAVSLDKEDQAWLNSSSTSSVVI